MVVCLSIWKSYVWHGVCLFVYLKKLCLAWGLSVCPSEQVMFGTGIVCLSVWTSYVWHGLCLFVRLKRLCLAWGLSVCSKHSWLIVFGIFGSPEKDCLLVLKRTVIVSPEKDCLLQQDLYSAILPGHCSLIIEVVLQVIPLSFGLSSRVSVFHHQQHHQSIHNHQAHHHHHPPQAADQQVDLDTGFWVCCAEPHRSWPLL